MKNLLCLLCLLLLITSAFAQQNTSKSISYLDDYTNYHLNQKDVPNIFLWEGFDSGVFPPSGWSVESLNQSHSWQSGDSTITQPMSGKNFAICRYDDTYQSEGQDEKLTTSVIDLSGLSDATLSFYFIFSRYWGITPHNNYDLQVLLSKNGGLTYSDTIWTELSTDTSAWSSWEWVKAEIDLSNYLNESQIKLCFRYVGFDGADAALEDIAISFLSSENERIKNSILVYPNPVENVIFFEGQSFDEITLIDNFGRRISSVKYALPQNSFFLGDVESGVYYLKLGHGASFITKKIVVPQK